MGLSGAQIWDMARTSNLTGISNALPKNFQTTQQQIKTQKDKQLQIEQASVNVAATNATTERMRTTGYTDASGKHVAGQLETSAATEAVRAQAEADQWKFKNEQLAEELKFKAKTEQQKNTLNQYQVLVDLKRAKGPNAVDPALMRAAEMAVAPMFGKKFKEVHGLSHYLTFGLADGWKLAADEDVDLTGIGDPAVVPGKTEDKGTPNPTPEVKDPKAAAAAAAGGK